MEWGPQLDTLIKAKQAGIPTPALDNRPVLRRDCVEYYDAFHDLSAGRTFGYGVANPIQVSEIEAYLRLLGVESREERLKYLRLVRKLDGVYLQHLSKKK